jgi:hypothetical protein
MLCAVLCTLLTVQSLGQQSQWVHLDESGKLVYQALKSGDRIMDFSSAGYMGGGVALPVVPVVKTVGPSGGDDDSAVIQAAIDDLAKFELRGEFRGAVLLKAGTYNCKSTLVIRGSGVVLRGSGSGADGTIIKLTGNPHLAIAISGGGGAAKAASTPLPITDVYVPSGATSFSVKDASGLAVGNAVLIIHPVTPAWVQFMGMDTLVRDGRKETWVSGQIQTPRTIKAISGSTITLDVPLSDCLDAKFLGGGGASVVKASQPARISQVGIESLRIVSPPQSVEITTRHNQAVRINGATDAWIKDLEIEETINSVGVGSSASRVTIQNVDIKHTAVTKGAAKPADFSSDGTQVLFDRCSATGDNLFYFVTGGRAVGPIVLLHCTFHGNGHIQPHMRWATGLLVDNCQVPESGIDFMNRGEMGTGHGWTIGWAVAWNCVAKSYVIQNPPGAANWTIGCKGERLTAGMPFNHPEKLPEGIFDSHGTAVAPASLYLAQLRERSGAEAVERIGY